MVFIIHYYFVVVHVPLSLYISSSFHLFFHRMVVCFLLGEVMRCSSKFLKFVCVGDGAVGKTSMLMSYTTNKFLSDYVPTVFDNFNATVSLDGSTVNLGLWDTAGQEDLSKLRPLSYRGADIFLLVFSLVSRASYENVFKKWIPELRRFAPNVPIVLVGSKLDLCNDTRYLANHPSAVAITTADGEKLRQQIGAAAYIECSSKTQKNIKAVFDTAIKVVVQPPQQEIKKKSWRRFTLMKFICAKE